MSEGGLMPNSSMMSPSSGTIAPNTSICGVPPMHSLLAEDSLTLGVLQAKLYQCVSGRIPTADVFADLSALDNKPPTWGLVMSILKPEDAAVIGSHYQLDFIFDPSSFDGFVVRLRGCGGGGGEA